MRPAIALLLLLYPRDFRQAYGGMIELQVRDELRSARGPFTAVRIITDVIRGAVAESVSAYRATAPDVAWSELARAGSHQKPGAGHCVRYT